MQRGFFNSVRFWSSRGEARPWFGSALTGNILCSVPHHDSNLHYHPFGTEETFHFGIRKRQTTFSPVWLSSAQSYRLSSRLRPFLAGCEILGVLSVPRTRGHGASRAWRAQRALLPAILCPRPGNRTKIHHGRR